MARLTGLTVKTTLICGVYLARAAILTGQSSPIVTTSGWGESGVAPDRAVISIGIETHLETAAAASDSLTVLLERVRRDIAGAGVSRDSVTTVYFSVTPTFRATNDGRRIPDGYRAGMQLEAPVNDLLELSDVIDAVITTGGTSLSGVRFESSHEDALRTTAIGDAVGKARSDAEALAEAAGMALGGLIELSTEDMATTPARAFMAARMESAPDFTPQEIVVRVRVVGRWRLAEQR